MQISRSIYWNNKAKFEDLVGKTILAITREYEFENQLHFHTACGKHYIMRHDQDCCETVELVDLDDDLSDLIGSPVVYAEERTDSGVDDDYGYSWTHTFYHIATNKGSTVIRWEGSSNGYYSESVDFVLVSDKSESTVH